MTKEQIQQVIAEIADLRCTTQKQVEEARIRFLG